MTSPEDTIHTILQQAPWLPTATWTQKDGYRVSYYDTKAEQGGAYTEYTTHMVVTHEAFFKSHDGRTQKRTVYSGDFRIGVRNDTAVSSEGAFWVYPTVAAYGFAPKDANTFLILAWLGIPILLTGLLVGAVTFFKSWEYFTTNLTVIPCAILVFMFIGWTIPIYRVHRELTDNNRIMKSLSGLSIPSTDEVYLTGVTFGGDLKGKSLEKVALTYLDLRKQLDYPLGLVKDAAPVVDWTPQRWIVTIENVGKDKNKEARSVGLSVDWMRKLSQ